MAVADIANLTRWGRHHITSASTRSGEDDTAAVTQEPYIPLCSPQCDIPVRCDILGGAFLIPRDSFQEPLLPGVQKSGFGAAYGDIDVTINVTNNVTINSVGFDLCGRPIGGLRINPGCH